MTSAGHQLEVLKDQIDDKKRLMASLPGWGDLSTRDEKCERAICIDKLAKMEYEYELFLENERIRSVVRQHEELHSPVSKECPICLEEIPIRSADSMVAFVCCGNGTCQNCYEAGGMITKCPLCRAKLPGSEEEMAALVARSAENGRAWSQTELGLNYIAGINGCLVDKKKASYWLKLAADQNDPRAMYSLAYLYKEGDGVEQSLVKARELMTDAANLGFTDAQRWLAHFYYTGVDGFSEDHSKALYYFTLASNPKQNVYAELCRGRMYYLGEGGLKESLYLATHYFERSAKVGCDPAYYYSYGKALLHLSLSKYDAMNGVLIDLPGHSAIPRILFWLRKAATGGDSDAIRLVREIEERGRAKCAHCTTEASKVNATMKCCARCKAAWYCGRECQAKAWKEGHKIDCVKHQT